MKEPRIKRLVRSFLSIVICVSMCIGSVNVYAGEPITDIENASELMFDTDGNKGVVEDINREELNEVSSVNGLTVTGDTGKEIFEEITSGTYSAPAWYLEKQQKNENPCGDNNEFYYMAGYSDIQKTMGGDYCTHSVSVDLDGTGSKSYIAYLGVDGNSRQVRVRLYNTETKKYSDYFNLDTIRLFPSDMDVLMESSLLYLGEKRAACTETYDKGFYSYYSITAGDYDGDKVDEIVVFATSDNHSAFYELSGIPGDIPSVQLSHGPVYDTEIINPEYMWEELEGYNMYEHLVCDLATADVNKDGIDDLIAVTGANVISPYLSVSYGAMGRDNIVSDSTGKTIGCKVDNLAFCGVDTGAVIEDNSGNMIVVSGYDDEAASCAIYVFDASNGQIEMVTNDRFRVGDYSNVVNSRFGHKYYRLASPNIPVKCVRLDGIGTTEYIFVNNRIYKFEGGKLSEKNMDHFKSIDFIHPMNIVVGNFDNDPRGREALRISGIDSLGKMDRFVEYGIRITSDNGATESKIEVYDIYYHDLSPIWITPYDEPGKQLIKLRYNKSDCIFCDPVPLAILQTPPYFNELGESKVSETSYSTSVSYANSYGEEEEIENGGGFAVGIELGPEALHFKSDTDYIRSFPKVKEWEKELKTTEEIAISVEGGEDDQVWLSVTPVAVYLYDQYDHAEDKWLENAIAITVPMTPIKHVLTVDQYNMYVDYYNKTAEGVEYPAGLAPEGGVSKLNAIDSSQYGLGNKGNPSGYVNVKHDYVGSTPYSYTGTQISARETEVSDKDSHSSSVKNEVIASWGVGTIGILKELFSGFASGSYKHEDSKTQTWTTTKSDVSKIECKICAPEAEERSGFGFDWSTASSSFYPYAGSDTKIPVIGYRVWNVVRGNLASPTIKVTKTTETEGDGKVTISWQKSEEYDGQRVDGYKLYVWDSWDGSEKAIDDAKPIVIEGKDNTSYEFESTKSGERVYYFQVSAYGVSNGKTVESKLSACKGILIDKEGASETSDFPAPVIESQKLDTANHSFTLEWKNPDVKTGNTITGYEIQIKSVSENGIETVIETEHVGAKYPKNTFTYDYVNDKTSPDYKAVIHGSIRTVGYKGNDSSDFYMSKESSDWSIEVEPVLVRFDSNDGDTLIEPIQATYGLPYGELPVATKRYKEFDGWCNEAGEKISADTIVTNEFDHILYAKWKDKEVTVSYDANGGVCYTESRTLIAGEKYGEHPVPGNENAHYKFDGWYTEKEGGRRIVADEIVESETNHTLYAHWSLITYSIHYVLDGGYADNNLPSNYTIETEDIYLGGAIKEGYKFAGWYVGDEKIEKIAKGSTGDITLTAKWKPLDREMYVYDINHIYEYTGKPIEPQVTVYNGSDKLVKGVDYSVVYRNNTNAYSFSGKTDAEVEKEAPAAIVTGKGDFSNTLKFTKYFEISQIDMKRVDAELTTPIVAFDNKQHNLIPNVTYDGNTLRNNKDFKLSYEGTEYKDGNCTKAGEYTITISATENGNYKGSKKITFKIVENKTLMSKVKVDKIESVPYKENVAHKPGTEDGPNVTVRYGSGKNNILALGVDYNIECVRGDDYTSAGEHTFNIVGVEGGKFVGNKKVSFYISGVPMSKVKVSGLNNTTYTGNDILLSDMSDFKLTYTSGSPKVTEVLSSDDYEISYLTQSVNVGTVKIKITGKKKYSGSIVKSYKILPKNVADSGDDKVSVELRAEEKPSVSYNKAGAIVKPTVSYNGMTLREGVDYKLSYRNNKKISSDNNRPEVIVTGIKNFKGRISTGYNISKANIISLNGIVAMVAPDMVENTVKEGKCFAKPILIEKETGKELKAGTDYKKDLTYTLIVDGKEKILEKTDKPLNGAIIKVTAEGCGNYEGTLSTSYRVICQDSNISKYKVDSITKNYTADKITLNKQEIHIRKASKADELPIGEFDILEDTYVNNLKRGTASVYVRGKDTKGGLIKIKFKITAQKKD